jgi:cytosine deaminase
MPHAGFVTVPKSNLLRLRRARVLACLLEIPLGAPANDDGLLDADIEIRDGIVSTLAPAGSFPAGDAIDLDGGQVWPAFADVHTHLDIGHTWPRAPNADGTFGGAVAAAALNRNTHWPAGDVRRRFAFGLRCAYAHGVAAVRTHLDSRASVAEERWAVFRDLREAWAGRIDLQATSIMLMDDFATDYGAALADLVARSGGQLGAVTRLGSDQHGEMSPDFERVLDRVFELAEARGLDLDFHVDESGDLGARTLAVIARTAIRRRFKGRILCGHCCSLAVQPEEVVKDTLAACAEAGLSVVSLPMCNMYLQSRAAGQTPRWRGVTLLHELAAQGIPVAVASDDCRNAYFSFGDHDMLEVYAQATRIAHLDRPYGDWPRTATRTPSSIMGLAGRGAIATHRAADLVLFNARTMSELLSRPQVDRVVLRRGQPIDTALPDYRELDDLQLPSPRQGS